jgi:3-dehydroquinate synthase
MNKKYTECYNQEFTVSYEYPVYFTSDIFSRENDVLADSINRNNEDRIHRIMVFIDDGVVKSFPQIKKKIRSYFNDKHDKYNLVDEIIEVPGGEKTKNDQKITQEIIQRIASNHLCRQSFIIAVGGGSLLDIVGFASSLVHRGIRLIRIPTTVLAQDDAGVGVKNGVDGYGVKNLTGTFAPPFAVLVDYLFLKTLDSSYWIGGVSEAFKVAIIKDRDFFNFLSEKADELKMRDEESIAEVVKRCAILHLEHIRTSGDPFEFGSARPLDFGHWSAHKLEALSEYKIGHGQAVSIGIALDTQYAYLTGLITEQECIQIIDALNRVGLSIWTDLFELKSSEGELEIIKGIDEFREHLGGQLTITLPEGIGNRIEVHEMDTAIIEKALKNLKQFSLGSN